MEGLETAAPSELLSDLTDGRAKLLVVAKGLALRAQMPELFHEGSYTALYADAGREHNVCAFALRHESHTLIAMAPRLFAHLIEEGGAPVGAHTWGDHVLSLPGDFPSRYRNTLTNEPIGSQKHGLRIADVLASFPVALLVSG